MSADAPSPNKLAEEDRKALAEARQVLEHPGLASRISDLVGMPVERTMKLLPAGVHQTVNEAATKSLEKALDVAVRSLSDKTDREPRLWAHKLMAGISGAAGGAFGLPALAIELPVSTVLILRSVADIARSHGEDLSDLSARLACLEVFAFGSEKKGDDATEIGYFAVRAGLAKHVTDAVKHLSKRSLADTTAPPLVRLLGAIASRFGVVVSEKVAAQAVPVIGAAGGALLNSFFIDHYQDIARAHFTIRQLERKYGEANVRKWYEEIKPKH